MTTRSRSNRVTSKCDLPALHAQKLPWEVLFYLGIFVAALLTRFIALDARVMSHDESLLSDYAWALVKGQGYWNTPLFHGPLTIHLTALSLWLFGDSDLTARIVPAAMGVLMVLMPKLLFERWLGKYGAMIASALILINPMLLYYSRYNREDTPLIFFITVMVYALFAYLDGSRPRRPSTLAICCAAMMLALATSEFALRHILIIASVVGLFWIFQLLPDVRRGVVQSSAIWVISLVILIVALFAVTISINAISNYQFTFISDDLIGVGLVIPPIIVCVGAIWALMGYRWQSSDNGDHLITSRNRLVATGIISGAIAALLITCILSLTVRRDVPNSPSVQVLGLSFLAVGLVAFFFFVVLLFSRRMGRNDAAVVASLTLTVAVGVAFFIQLSFGRFLQNYALVGTANHVVDNRWIVGTWLIALTGILLILGMRLFTRFFQDMAQYAPFDVLIMISTLVIPWLSPIPIMLAGYDLSGGGSYSTDVLKAALWAVLPLTLLSVVLGLCWKPRFWTANAFIAYAIYACLFTNMFTSPENLPTGIIGTLGYWIAQQQVQRGNEPSYVYLFIQLPLYEYLDVIGAVFAGIAGLVRLWRSDSRGKGGETKAPNVKPSALDLPFPLFCGLWAVLLLVDLTLIGAKMPWLVINVAIPLIFITGWYLGTVIEQNPFKNLVVGTVRHKTVK